MLHRVTTGKALVFLLAVLTADCGRVDPGNQPAIDTGILVSGAGGTTVHLGTPLDFTWTDDSNPDGFRLGISATTA
ncbi:MAG: hypothetical protein ACREK8_06935 [Gemmatimonadales bacterium]